MLRIGTPLISKIAQPKYILFGNHEYENIHEKEKCYLLKQQKELFATNAKNVFFDNVMTHQTADTLIIMIDTTIYEEPTDTLLSKTCFNHIFTTMAKQPLTVAGLIEEQERQVVSILSNNLHKKNIIFIGHHPIITCRNKEDKKEKKEKKDGEDGEVKEKKKEPKEPKDPKTKTYVNKPEVVWGLRDLFIYLRVQSLYSSV